MSNQNIVKYAVLETCLFCGHSLLMYAVCMTNVSGSITKAVIPAAGLGTRFLPATKATPKEMLPVVDRPAIQYVVEEAIRAGLQDVLMITGRNKRALEDHFDRVPVLERQLAEQGKEALLKAVEESNYLGEIHYVRQGDPKGLGHAVLRGKVHVGNEPFAVLLGDDLIDEKEDLLSRMVEVQQRTGGSVVALMEVPREAISAYGAAAIETVAGEDFVKVTGLVEKPEPEQAARPSPAVTMRSEVARVLVARVAVNRMSSPYALAGAVSVRDGPLLRIRSRRCPCCSRGSLWELDGVRHE